MLILILIAVQYSQKASFTFKITPLEVSSPGKKIPPNKISDSPVLGRGNLPFTPPLTAIWETLNCGLTVRN